MSSAHSVGFASLIAALTLTCLVAAFPPISVLAQSASPSSNCERASPTAPATPVDKSADSGSKNMGSTGWSGAGIGGSHNDTSQSGPTPGSKTDQPATAQGLDPTKPSSRPKC
jgi:hypothetical protein